MYIDTAADCIVPALLLIIYIKMTSEVDSSF